MITARAIFAEVAIWCFSLWKQTRQTWTRMSPSRSKLLFLRAWFCTIKLRTTSPTYSRCPSFSLSATKCWRRRKLVSEINFICLWCSAALHRSPIRRLLLALVLVRNWPSSERHGPSAVPETTWRDSTCRKRGDSNSIKEAINIQHSMVAQWWVSFLHPSFWVNAADVSVV